MIHLRAVLGLPHLGAPANPRIDPLLPDVIVRVDGNLQGRILLLAGAGCPERA